MDKPVIFRGWVSRVTDLADVLVWEPDPVDAGRYLNVRRMVCKNKDGEGWSKSALPLRQVEIEVRWCVKN